MVIAFYSPTAICVIMLKSFSAAPGQTRMPHFRVSFVNWRAATLMFGPRLIGFWRSPLIVWKD